MRKMGQSTRGDIASMPYSKLIEILRYMLEQVEKDVFLHTDSANLREFRCSLKQRLEDLERRASSSELDS